MCFFIVIVFLMLKDIFHFSRILLAVIFYRLIVVDVSIELHISNQLIKAYLMFLLIINRRQSLSSQLLSGQLLLLYFTLLLLFRYHHSVLPLRQPVGFSQRRETSSRVELVKLSVISDFLRSVYLLYNKICLIFLRCRQSQPSQLSPGQFIFFNYLNLVGPVKPVSKLLRSKNHCFTEKYVNVHSCVIIRSYSFFALS
jgi:hypothetical protein